MGKEDGALLGAIEGKALGNDGTKVGTAEGPDGMKVGTEDGRDATGSRPI